MKNFRIVTLSILLIAAIAIPLNGNQDGCGNCDEHGIHEKEHCDGHRLWKKLDLSDGTIEEIKDLKLEHQKEMIDLRSKIQQKRIEMKEIILADNLDEDRLLSVHNDIGELKFKMHEKSLKHRIEIYNLLPDEKKGSVKKMLFSHHAPHKELRHGHPALKRR